MEVNENLNLNDTEDAVKKLEEMILEFNSMKTTDLENFNDEILFPVDEDDMPTLKEVIEFKDDKSDLLKDVSAEIKKTEE